MSSEKEIELTVERAKAQEELEAECAMRMSEVMSKLPTIVSRLKPSQTVLSIRSQVRDGSAHCAVARTPDAKVIDMCAKKSDPPGFLPRFPPFPCRFKRWVRCGIPLIRC
jgi:hypothetical protein